VTAGDYHSGVIVQEPTGDPDELGRPEYDYPVACRGNNGHGVLGSGTFDRATRWSVTTRYRAPNVCDRR